MAYISSKLFDFDHDTNTFTAWVSELGPVPFGPVVDSNYNLGCSIVSSKTGHIADFFIDAVEKDDEQDVLAWHLKPTSATKTSFPLLKETKVVIFND